MKFLYRVRKKLADRSGGITPLLAGIVILVIFLSGAIYEFISCFVIAEGVRDAMQNAANNASTQNYYNAYPGEKCGCSGAYSIDDDGNWADNSGDGNIEDSIDNTLGLTIDGGEHIKWDSGEQQYSISNISVSVNNPPLGSAGSGFKICVKYMLKINIVVFGISTPITVPQSVNAGFTQKF